LAFQGINIAHPHPRGEAINMVTSNLSSHWYDGFTTDDLVRLLPQAKERAERTPDHLEKELWKIRVERMELELLRRQNRLDEFEV